MRARHHQGGNTKALEALARKKAVAIEKQRKKMEFQENERWRDDDKYANAKINRKKLTQQKAEERCERKAALRQLVAEEESKLHTSNKSNMNTPKKLSRIEIAQRALLTSQNKSANKEEQKNIVNDIPLERNPNHLILEEIRNAAERGEEYIDATGVDDALSALIINDPVDRNPTRRMKAAYIAYEEVWLPKLREQYPTLKRSQLKEILWKQWTKAAENPLTKT